MFIIRFSCGFFWWAFFFPSPNSVVAHGLYLISFYSCTKESKVGRKRAANLNTSAGKPSSINGFDAFERDGQGHQVRSCLVVPNRIKTRLLFYLDFICFSILYFYFYIDMFLSLLVPRRRLDSSVRFAAHMNSPPNLKNNQIDERHVTSYANVVHTHTHICRDHHFSRSKSLVRLSDEFYSFSRFA